jgi:hypothetical protein
LCEKRFWVKFRVSETRLFCRKKIARVCENFARRARNEQLQRILRKKSRAFFKNFAQRVFRTCSEGARCVLGGSSVGPRRVLGACSVGARWVLGGSCVGAEFATRKKDRKSEKRETVVQNDGLGGARWVLGGCSVLHLRLKVASGFS